MIVDSIDILKRHVATIADVGDFNIYSSYVMAAGGWLRNHITGDELYYFAELHKDDPEHSGLVDRLQRIISLNAFLRAVPFLDLALTNTGFGVANTEKIAPASKERVASLRAGLQAECGEAVEDLLKYLEDSEAYHADWKESPVYTLLTDTFLPSYDIFKRYAPYSERVENVYPKSRMDFVKLFGKMREVMEDKIKSATGDSLTQKIIEELRSGTLGIASLKILEPLRFALACYTLGLDVDGDNFISKVLSIIKENAGDYPEWTDRTAKDGNSSDSPIIKL
jgi:hypothetical protein